METSIDWTSIEAFVGYGRLDDPVVFIGMEEGAASDGVEADLRRRSAYVEIKPLNSGRAYQPTWSKMTDLMLRRAGIEPSPIERATYQAKFGALDGDTLVMELLPYPHRKASDWEDVFRARFPTRAAYETGMIPIRARKLRAVLSSAQRELVICYGRAHWPHYKALFPNTVWATNDAFETSWVEGARVVLCPHFTSRAFNGQGKALARVALQDNLQD